MKQSKIRFLLLALLLAVKTSLFADYFEVDGIRYFTTSSSTVEVTHKDDYSGDIIIPASVEYGGKSYSVTSIGYETFHNCSSLVSVTIPNSMTSIRESAFSSCSNLTSVNIPNSVTSIGMSAFCGCSKLTSISIGNGVKLIGDDAFWGCNSLKSIGIGCGVTSIGKNAFEGCNSLTSVYINDIAAWCNIKYDYYSSNPLNYAKHLYLNGEEIKDLVIPNSVTSIGFGAFYNCSSLISVSIPNSVTTIGDGAFSGCGRLSSMNIPNSVTSIGIRAFQGCTNLTLQIESPNPVELNYTIFDSNSSVSLEVPIGSTVAYARSDYWNEALMIYANDKGKKYYPILPINNYVGDNFLSINGLSGEGIELSEDDDVIVQVSKEYNILCSMVMKGDCEITDFFTNGAYNYKPIANYRQNTISTYSYPYYKDISLSESGTLIDKIGIENIDNLECLKLSGNINGTDILTIRKMKNLKLLDLSKAHIINGGMSYFDNYITSENTIGEHFYDGLKRLFRIKLPLDIHTIKRKAFMGCDSLMIIYIPKSVKTVSTYWTEPLYRIRSVQIEDLSAWCKMKAKDVVYKYHSFHLFLKDKEITELVIPDDIKAIDIYAFRGCAWIKSISFPSSFTSMGKGAFIGCTRLTSVTSYNPLPPEVERQTYESEGVFEKEAYENATLYVPKGSKTLYWLHPYWENFKNIVELDGTSINDITVTPSPKSKGVYTIDGVKLSANAGNTENLPKGIYIINGQKVVIK